MKIHVILLSTFISMWACLGLADEQRPSRIPPIAQFMLECTPQDITMQTVLKVKLPPKHGGDLAIVSPSGEYFFIAFDQPDRTIDFIPPIPYVVFEKMTDISLKISSLEGISWKKRTMKAEPIFTKRGTYKLVVSPGLQTEDPEIDGWCLLYFNSH